MNDSRHWDRVQALFGELLEMKPEEREALLERTAVTDPQVAEEVRSLLGAHLEASGFLAGTAISDLSNSMSPGERIGPYRILEESGRGGMGVVYRATRDDSEFTKEVAIKLIYPGLQSADILRRFRAERQILAVLDHPGIARLIDGGSTADGQPFLVMDYVSGVPLTDYCDRHRLGIEERIRIFLSVCDAVQFAHQRLVVHRDLKPDNILVGDDGSPRLLDFGIARLLSPEGEIRGTLTAPMERVMTPEYASPELIRGAAATVAGDVYSLGVVLYELLTGVRPLQFKSRTPEEVLRVTLEEDPVRPSLATRQATAETAAVRKETTDRLHRRLAGDLDTVILKALEKEPERRYGSVDQFAADLRRHLEGLPVLARRQSTGYLVSRFVRRHRLAVGASVLVLFSLLAGLLGTTWQAGVARRERDLARRRFEEVRALAHAVMYDIHDAIVDLPGSTKAREMLVEHSVRYLEGLGREVRNDPALQHEIGIAWAKIADVQGRPMFPNLGKSAEALESYRRGLTFLALAKEARPESLSYARDYAVTTQRLADVLNVTGQPEEAMAEAVSALELIESLRVRFPDDPWLPGDVVLSRDRMGDWKLAAADTQGAMVEREFCMNFSEEMFRRDPRDVGWRRSVIIHCCKTADLLGARGDRAGAKASYARAEKLGLEAVQALGNNTEARRDLSIVYGLMGLFLAQADTDSGLLVYEKGMRISEEMAREDPANMLMKADVASGHFEIGTMLMDGGRFEEAEGRFGEAYNRYSGLAAEDTANVGYRLFKAHSSRSAGLACIELARTNSGAARVRWKNQAIQWIETSRGQYLGLEQDGLLAGSDAAVPEELGRELTSLRRSN